MNDTGALEVEARKHIKYIISETWKKLNKEEVLTNSPFTETYIGVVVNTIRMGQCIYQHGDGHGIQDRETKDHVLSLLVQHI